ncbi:MAG: MOP flippase family protein [Gammaproteobacteria bacterium]
MEDFKRKVTRGVRWTSINTISATLIQLVELSVLAHLLGPETFGLMAIISVVVGFAGVFSDVGLSSAVIQKKSSTHEELSTLYWINVGTGFVVFILFTLISPLIATSFGSTELRSMLPVAALSFVITSFGTQFVALIHKQLRFDIVTKFSVASSLLGMSVSIILALCDFGVWALIWGDLSTTLSLTIMRVAWAKTARMLPSLHFNWQDKRGYLSFGSYRMATLFINQIHSRIDLLLIGALLGPIVLGYYNIAFRLAMAPIMKINSILTTVAFPAFSSVQDNEVLLKKGFMKMIGLVTSANAPILVGMAALAPLLVPALFGEQWRPSIPLVQVLAIYSLLRSFANAASSLILAKGKADWAFYWNLALSLLVPPVIFAAAKTDSALNICYALVALQMLIFFVHYRVFVRNLIGPCFNEYVKVILRPVILAACMGILMFLASNFAPINNKILALSLSAIGGICAYAALSLVFQRPVVSEIMTFFIVKRKR